jgi:pyridoxal phosphate phosphatase PHOSPHO2
MFIQLVLQHHGLLDRFDGAVITNPAHWDPQEPNRLLLRRKVGPQDTPHGCTLGCSANMCKGKTLFSPILSYPLFVFVLALTRPMFAHLFSP